MDTVAARVEITKTATKKYFFTHCTPFVCPVLKISYGPPLIARS